MLMNRLMGVITFKAPTYREIADDQNATTTAGIIVVVMALVTGVLSYLFAGVLGAAFGQPAVVNALGTAVRIIVNVLVGWLFGSWVFAFVSKTFFGGKTNTGEMLRVFGYTQVFRILDLVPICGWIVGPILSIIAAVIGIREASEFDTTKAILTGLVGFVVLLVVSVLVGIVLALVGL